MEVEAYIHPIDLQIEEISVREVAKIQSKNIAEKIKQHMEGILPTMKHLNVKNLHLVRL